MDVLLDFIQTYKVGDIYITTQNENPAARLGYGVWERYAEGKALVGFSSSTSNQIPEWVKTGGGEYGEYSTILEANHLPKKTNYTYQRFTNQTSGDIVVGGIDPNGNAKYNNIEPVIGTVGDQPHNNVQPSITVYVWRRIS